MYTISSRDQTNTLSQHRLAFPPDGYDDTTESSSKQRISELACKQFQIFFGGVEEGIRKMFVVCLNADKATDKTTDETNIYDYVTTCPQEISSEEKERVSETEEGSHVDDDENLGDC